MAEFMYAQVTKAIITTISNANYVVLTRNEVSTMDNGGWISIHTYVMQNCVKVPILFSLQKVVNGTRVDNLIVEVMEAL
jgi:hypothetical protein